MINLSRKSRSAIYRIGYLTLLLAIAPSWVYAQQRTDAIYVMKANGSQARKVVQLDGYADHGSPRWSPDGQRILFHAVDTNSRASELFIVKPDGTGLKKIGDGARPDWSPDGKQIAFDSGNEVFVQNVDGQGRERIGAGESPRWSPDGSKIAVVDDDMLFTIDFVTGERVALLNQPYSLLYRGVGWSPDGRQIAAVGHPVEGPRRQLLIVNSQGAEHGFRARLQTQGGMSSSPAFSPDGKQIAYSAGYLIMVVDVEDTGRPRMLPEQKGRNFEPHWSPDGEWLVFTSDRQ